MVETKDTKKDTEDKFSKVPVIKVRFMTDEEWNKLTYENYLKRRCLNGSKAY